MNKVTRKVVVGACVLGLVATLGAGPALAGKKKSGSFTAENHVPFPDPSEGCLDSQEGINKTTEEVKAPFTGVLTVTMESFDGDWDLFVTDKDGNELVSATESQLQGAPPTEEATIAVKKGFVFQMVACNWIGGPSAEVKWQLVASK